MKKILPLLLLLFNCQSFAQSQNDTQRSPYTYSLAFLYWEVKAVGGENWGQLIPSSGSDIPVKILSVPFKITPGFRIGIARQGHNSFWKTDGIFTHYKTKATGHASGSVYSDYLGNFYIGNNDGSSSGPYYDQGDIQWIMDYNTIDFNVSHPFAADDMLSLTPYFGVKAASINQTIETQWQNPNSPTNVTPPRTYSFTTASEDLKNDYLGIGPSIGVNSTWLLLTDGNKKLSINGNVMAALMLGHWRFDDHYQSTNGSSPVSSDIRSRDFYSASTMVGGLLGLEYKESITRGDIFVRLGYEAQVWFNQLQYYAFNMGRTNNLMSLQGLTLDVSLNLK